MKLFFLMLLTTFNFKLVFEPQEIHLRYYTPDMFIYVSLVFIACDQKSLGMKIETKMRHCFCFSTLSLQVSNIDFRF